MDFNSSPADAPNPSLLRPLAEDLRARRAQLRLGGGETKIAAQRALLGIRLSVDVERVIPAHEG